MSKGKALYLLLFLFFLSAYADTDKTDSLTPNGIASPSTYSVVVFDPNLSMRGGAETIISVHNELTIWENRYIRPRLFSEEKPLGKAGGVVYRLSKYTIIDLPVDIFSFIFAHEYFGHGARLREQDWVNIQYEFEIPPPYGSGNGHVSAWPSSSRMYSDHELLAFYSGGMEVQSLMNRGLCLRWIERREIQYREAFFYFFSFWANFNYIISTSIEDMQDQNTGHDVALYLRLINRHAGYSDINNLLMNAKNLNYRNMTNLANPFLFYALYTSLKTYIWYGNPSNKIPMFSIKGIDYLPSFRMGLAPFGPEYHLENYFQAKNTIFLLDLRIGDNTFHKSWSGIGLFCQNIYENKRFSLDAKLDVWKQPEIEIGGENSITLKGGTIGGAFSIRGHYDFTSSQYPISAILELGYKSPGFLEGYALDSSPIIMFGIGIHN
jgi:hypothetical protein